MIYISFNDLDERNNAIDVLKDLGIKDNKYFIDSSNDQSIEMLRKSDLIISDASNEIIKTFVAFKKKVIIYRKFKVNEDLNNTISLDMNVMKYSQKSELREILSYELKQNKKKKVVLELLALSVVLIFALVACFNLIFKEKKVSVDNKYKDENINEKTNDENKQNENNNVDVNKVDYKYENIVFYGDSITDYYDLEKFYGDLPVINSGTSGFQTTHLLDLVDERVIKFNPTKVFIMIGTNDIANSDITNEGLVSNIEKLIKLIHKSRSKTKIYIESIYPVHSSTDNDIVNEAKVITRDNKRISKLNSMIKDMCEKNKVEYIDMHSELIDENDELVLDYTYDGLHLNDNGYEVVTKKIMEYIDPYRNDSLKSKTV